MSPGFKAYISSTRSMLPVLPTIPLLCLMILSLPSSSLSISLFSSSTTARIKSTTRSTITARIQNIQYNPRLYLSKKQNEDNQDIITTVPNTLQNDDTSSTSTRTNTSTSRNLTLQERILQESLGIQPETPQEKETRIKSRQAQISQEQKSKRTNILVAIVAFSLAILNYTWQYTHPITSLTLLTEMQRNSQEFNVIGNNGKPTIVDFWAPWCENCKASAPTLASIEKEYKDRVNFILVDGDKGENWPMIERFGVDAIPHLAMVGSDGVVETALIGPIPRRVLREDLDAMLENAQRRERGEGKVELPFVMYDAFRTRPELKQLNFVPAIVDKEGVSER
eukprot:CAMPEP_0176502278 /NCGR_PEP_ID=MMETSP0200_2-20121128/14659_1 /TAXON_ID=947934 /ORGANISM="Chaetoceros sp., Strain GSL56" /LENGTH=337 /DNA_ID=CAMNT_0017901321 /DNA_START=112 /DNA_END=1125 /DNA_ORIENTATION=+